MSGRGASDPINSTVSFVKLAGAVEYLTAAQRAMLLTLSGFRRPATVAMLVEATELHPNSVRDSLAVLHENGLVERRPISSGKRGRPAWEYEPVVPPSISAIMTAFASFAAATCEYLRENSEDPETEAYHFGRMWGERVFDKMAGETGLRSLDMAIVREGRNARSEQVRRAMKVVSSMQRKSSGGKDAVDADLDHPLHAKAEVLSVQMRFLSSVFGFGALPAEEGEYGVRLGTCPFANGKKAPDSLVCRIHAGMAKELIERSMGEGTTAEVDANFPRKPCVIRVLLPEEDSAATNEEQ